MINLRKKIKKYILAFTLVELIVVITLIAILGTIILMSFLWYTRNARSAVRINDMANIVKGIELFVLKSALSPYPDENQVFTWTLWREIRQWIIGINVSQNIWVFGDLVDPDSWKKYMYSIFWNSKYYQIATEYVDKEVSVLPYAYANTNTTIIKWNYYFDPSLPSLLVVPSSITGSWIFDPNVCFIVDGGVNTRDICSEKKKEMTMKNYDERLIAYWDMETSFSSWSQKYLKDFSWNNNNWLLTWWLDPSQSWSLIEGQLWKALVLDWNLNYIRVDNSTSLNPEHISFSATVKHFWNGVKSNYRPRMFSKWSDLWSLEQYAFYNNFNGASANIFQINLWTEVRSGWVVYGEKSYGDLINTFYNVVGTYNGKSTKIYVDWLLDNESTDTFSWVIVPSTQNLIIWNSSWPHGYSRAFYWLVDDIKIYQTPLLDEEIKQQAKVAGY